MCRSFITWDTIPRVKRLLRISHNLLCIASLLAFVALLAVCAIGYNRELDVGWGSRTFLVFAWTSWGRRWLNCGRAHDGAQFPVSAVEQGWWAGAQDKGPSNATEKPGWNQHLNRAGFRIMSGDEFNGRWIILSVPAWFPILLAALPPAQWFRRRRLQHRSAIKGRCRDWGYDSRATPARCRECGTKPAE